MTDGSEQRTLEEALLRFHASEATRRKTAGSITKRRFAQYAWKSFDAREVIAVLASPKASFPGHKPVLFAGLCAWIMNPVGRGGLSRAAMTLNAAKLVHRAEVEGRRSHKVPFVGEMRAKLLLLGPDFFEQIYYPMGGLNQVLRHASRDELQIKLKARALPMQRALTMMTIFHHHAEHLLDTELYRKPSIETAANLVIELDTEAVIRWQNRKKLPEGTMVKRCWRSVNPSIAFAYAAMDVTVAPGRNLLDVIIDGTATYADHGKHLPELLGKTTYVVEQVLARCYETDTATRFRTLLPRVEAIAVAPPSFSQNATVSIRKAFTIPQAERLTPTAPGGTSASKL